MKLRPLEALNHPRSSPLIKVLATKVPVDVVKARAYQQLVTRQGVLPARAKELLGLK